MQILVTGASGFVGRHLVQLLAEQGHAVVAWSYTHASFGHGISQRTLDMRDRDAVSREDLVGIDAVVHLAGLAQVSRSFSEPDAYVSTNAELEIQLLESLLEQRASPRVLIASSGGVYGESSTPLTESSPVKPSNPYVVSKLTQELLATYYSQRGLDIVIARPFNHIGPGQQRGYLVADIASQIAELERAGGGELRVGNLSSARDYTDVRDVAAAYLSLLLHGRPGEIYNVCSRRSLTGEEIADTLLALTELRDEITTRSADARPTDVLSVTASNRKIHSETGWEPSIALQTTLADTLDYWRRS